MEKAIRYLNVCVVLKKELKYFTYILKNDINLLKLYFLLEKHKRLSSVLGRLVISNCGTPMQKFCEYLNYIFEPIIQDRW